MKKILPLLAFISFLGAGSLIVFAAIGPAGTVKCADENSICTLGGSTRIAYGANGVFFYKTVPAGTVFIACDNATFGDPVYGVAKACYKETLLTQILLPWKNNQGGNVEEKQSNGYLVTIGTSKEVTVNYPSISECKKITATTKNIFVPTLTANEWEKFKARVSNVGGSIGNCGSSVVVGYGWDVGTWGVCNAECGTNTNQYRTVQCRELTSLSPKVFGNVVSDVSCSAMAKPTDVQGCIGSNNCPVCNMNGVQDNGETGIDCGGPTCAACGQQQPTQTISGPSLQCIYFAPSMYYKINYYTQTNPNLGFIQDQIYNVAGLGNASFQGYGSFNTIASWAQPAENPPVAYVDSNCTMTSLPQNNSCTDNPGYLNATYTNNPPTSGGPGQQWQNANPAGACYYSCTDGYSGNDCGTAPAVAVNGSCGSVNGQSSGTNPITSGGNLCASGTPSGTSYDSITGQATWQCDGSNGVTNQACSARYSVTGWCSAAEGGTWATLPSQLCYRGSVASGPTEISAYQGADMGTIQTGWTWSCGGLNGGTSVVCNANYAPSTGGGNDGGGCGGAGGSCGGE